MSKLLPTIMAVGFMVNSAYAQGYGAMSYHYGNLTTENKNIMQIQSLSEIVGGNSTYHQIRYGISAVDSDHISKGDIYLLGYSAPEKNNELGLGLGAGIHTSPFTSLPKLTLKLAGEAAIGYQPVKGESKVISTNINKLAYVMSMNGFNAYKVPTRMTYYDDTYVFALTLSSGIGYELTPNLRLEGDFAYRAGYYQFAYQNTGSSVVNNLTAKQDQWISTLGLTYRF